MKLSLIEACALAILAPFVGACTSPVEPPAPESAPAAIAVPPERLDTVEVQRCFAFQGANGYMGLNCPESHPRPLSGECTALGATVTSSSAQGGTWACWAASASPTAHALMCVTAQCGKAPTDDDSALPTAAP